MPNKLLFIREYLTSLELVCLLAAASAICICCDRKLQLANLIFH